MAFNGKTINGGRTGRRFHWLKITLLIVSLLYINLYGLMMLGLKTVAGQFVQQELSIPPETLRLGAGLVPFGLTLQASELAYDNGDEKGAFRDLVITIPFFAPWQVVTELDGVNYQNAKLTLSTGDITTRIKWVPSRFTYKSDIDDFNVVVTQLVQANPETPPVRIKHIALDYSLRLDDNHNQSQPEEETRFVAEPINLPFPGNDAPQIDRLEWRMTAEPALPRNMRDRAEVQAWQQAGGVVTIAPLAIDLLGMNISLRGPIELDMGLDPMGNLKMSLVGIDKAYGALGTYNEKYQMMKPEQYQMLGNLLALAPDKGAGQMEFPVKIENRAFTFIKAPLFAIGKLPWDIVPQAVEEAVPEAVPLPEGAPQMTPIPEAMPAN